MSQHKEVIFFRKLCKQDNKSVLTIHSPDTLSIRKRKTFFNNKLDQNSFFLDVSFANLKIKFLRNLHSWLQN